MSLEEIKGTPKYLTGKAPSLYPKEAINWFFTLGATPQVKMLLLSGLGARPDISLKELRHSNMREIEKVVVVKHSMIH